MGDKLIVCTAYATLAQISQSHTLDRCGASSFSQSQTFNWCALATDASFWSAVISNGLDRPSNVEKNPCFRVTIRNASDMSNMLSLATPRTSLKISHFVIPTSFTFISPCDTR